MKVKEDSEKAGLKLNIQKSKIMASVPISSGQIGGEKVEIVSDFISFHIRKDMKSMRMVSIAIKLKDTCSLEKSYDQPRQRIKKQKHHFSGKGLYSQSYVFSSSHV